MTTTDTPPPPPSRGDVTTITSALGGSGASTLTLLLARSLAGLGARVAVVDADPAGGLGAHLGEGLGPRLAPGLRWGDLPAEETAFRPAHLSRALPTWHGCHVLTADDRGGPEHPDRLDVVLDALAREHDHVLVDLPRAWPAPPCRTGLLLTSRELRSALAAQVLAPRLASVCDDVGLVLRGTGEDLDGPEVAALVCRPVVGILPHDRSVRQRAARGDDVTSGRGATRRAARALAEHLHGPGTSPHPVPVTTAWAQPAPSWYPLTAHQGVTRAQARR